jgi:glycosyltransferase involved in cell wall biosynthesis
MRYPIVSVVLSTYNGSAFIADQLASLASQTRRPDRLVLRDDGSTDDSVLCVENWARAEMIELQNVSARERLGPARSFLTALKAAAPADVFLFCDQDDVWLPDKIERAVREIINKDSSQPYMVATRLLIVDAELQPIGLSPIPQNLSFGSAVCESVVTGCTLAFNDALRQLLVREIPLKFEMHDWWCYMLASGSGQVSFDAKPSIKYRQHHGNAVGIGPDGFKLAFARILRFIGSNSSVRSEQLIEFARLHASDIHPDANELLHQLISAKQSLPLRLRAALKSTIQRQSRARELATRIALITNRF